MKFPDNAANNDDKESESVRIKLKWKAKKDDETNGGYDENILMSRLEKVRFFSDIFFGRYIFLLFLAYYCPDHFGHLCD